MRKEYLTFSPPTFGEEEIAAVVATLRSDWGTSGSKVKRFEERFASTVGAQAALASSSCTAGLHLALTSLGIGPGDAVAITPLTFCSTVHVIEQLGARPVLVDIEPDTLNIDPVKLRKTVDDFVWEEKWGCRLKAILPVHLFGHPCEMDSVLEIAREQRLAVIEDASHSLPAKYKGRAIGSWTPSFSTPVLTWFSFYAAEDLTTVEGGMLTGSLDAIEEARVCSLPGMNRDARKRYGAESSWYFELTRPGINYNMTGLQAAIGLSQLSKLSQFHSRREEIARRYNVAFSQLSECQIPIERKDVEHAWHSYVLRLNLSRLNLSRDQFISELRAHNIASSANFTPIHMHPYYRDKYGYQPGDFPVACREYQRMVSLPLYPRMSDQDVQDVIEAVTEIAHDHAVTPLRAPDLPKTQMRPSDYKSSDGNEALRRDQPLKTKVARIMNPAFRRTFDLACAMMGLVVLSPIFLIVIAAIKLEGGGPVFFSQPRIGKGLGKFRILKFRTMRPSTGEASLLTSPEDPRVTRVGRFLRKYKVDELPQLVNVVRGEMQLVGVRPQVECFVEAFHHEYEELLRDRPGITDPATMAFRNEEKLFQAGPLEMQYVSQILPRKLVISLKYSQARSFSSDLEILLRTVLGSKGTTTTRRQVRR